MAKSIFSAISPYTSMHIPSLILNLPLNTKVGQRTCKLCTKTITKQTIRKMTLVHARKLFLNTAIKRKPMCFYLPFCLKNCSRQQPRTPCIYFHHKRTKSEMSNSHSCLPCTAYACYLFLLLNFVWLKINTKSLML